MTRFVNIAAKSLAVLCAICFVVTAVSSLLLFNFEQRAFNPNIYTEVLVNENVYQSLPSLLGSVLVKDAGIKGTPFANQLTGENWAALIQTLLPPEQLQAMTEDAVTQIFAYLNNKNSNPHISLMPLKLRLSGPAGLDATINLLHTQPDCTFEQVAQMAASSGPVLCNPPQIVLNFAKPVIQTQLNLITANLPDQISLLSANAPPPKAGSIRNIRLAMQFSPLLPVVFLLLVTLFMVRTFKGWMIWWGWPILIAGTIGAVSGFNGEPLFRMALENYISTRTQLSIPPELLSAMHGVMDQVLRKIFQPVVWQALILVGIGLIMLLIGLIISRMEKHQRIERSEAKTQMGI